MTTVINTAKLRQLIEAKFGTQMAFANECGVSTQYIWQIVHGKFSPTLERAVQFADLLGVRVDDLVLRGTRGEDEEEAPDNA